MSLQSNLKEQMKEAMKAKDTVRLSVVRGLMAAMGNEAIATGKGPAGELTDEEAIAVIRKEGKKRKDSIEQFTNGGRPELAESEKVELAIIETYLPTLMSAEQVKPIVEAKMKELGWNGSPLRQAQGKLMQAVMHELKGKADGMVVKNVVESLLA